MTTDDIKILADSEMETGRSLAIGLGIVSIASLVIVSSFVAATAINLLPLAFLGIVAFGAAAATGVLFWAWRRRNKIIAYFMPAPVPAPLVISTPALPEVKESVKDETPELSRGGDTTRKLHGLPALTVEYMCNFLGNKNSWAEGRLEKMPVPYIYPPARFGKAEKNSIYNQLFHPERGIFCRAGIIDERGGPGNDKGKLLVDNPVEMMERLKALPEE